jgi:hypothetical protein
VFLSSIERGEAYVDGEGKLRPPWIGMECPANHAARAVVGVGPDTGMQRRPHLEAIKDFRINPAHWLPDIFGRRRLE